MERKYKVVTILFSLETANNPFRMISDIQDHYKRDGCVIALKSYCGNLFVCTLCDVDIVARVKQENFLYIGRNKCKYKEVDSNITALKIDVPYRNVTIDDVNRMLRVYCNVLVSHLDREPYRTYYAIVEQRREVPTRLKSKCGFVDVVELV